MAWTVLLVAPPVRAPSRETPPRQASVIGSTGPIPRRPRPGDRGIRGGGQDSSWSLERGCNQLSKVAAIAIFPFQVRLNPRQDQQQPAISPLKKKRARHAVPEQRAWLQMVPETLATCLLLSVVRWNELTMALGWLPETSWACDWPRTRALSRIPLRSGGCELIATVWVS